MLHSEILTLSPILLGIALLGVPLTTLVLDNEKSRASFTEYQGMLRRWKGAAAAASKGASTQQTESEEPQDT